MKRVLSALVLGAVVVYVVLFTAGILGPLVASAVIFAAAYEMVSLLERAGCSPNRKAIMVAVALMLLVCISGDPHLLSVGLVAGGMLILLYSRNDGSVKGSVKRASAGIFVLFVPAWCLAHLFYYLQTTEGRRSLMFLLICVWVSDSAAYYIGRAFGNRRLAQEISPNKTVLGSAAGIFGAVFAALLLRGVNFVAWPYYSVLLSGFLLSVIAQGGDLFESMIKRDVGVKDSGALIPGHGGILDRVDALLFTIPVFYYGLPWLQGFQS